MFSCFTLCDQQISYERKRESKEIINTLTFYLSLKTYVLDLFRFVKKKKHLLHQEQVFNNNNKRRKSSLH